MSDLDNLREQMSRASEDARRALEVTGPRIAKAMRDFREAFRHLDSASDDQDLRNNP